jgi:hypothetical protein
MHAPLHTVDNRLTRFKNVFIAPSHLALCIYANIIELTARPSHRVSTSTSSPGIKAYLFAELAYPLNDALALVCSVFHEQCLCPQLEAWVAVLLDDV